MAICTPTPARRRRDALARAAAPLCDRLERRMLLSNAPANDGTTDPDETPFVLVHGLFGSLYHEEHKDEWFVNRGLSPDKLVLDPLAGFYDDLVQTMVNAGYDRGQVPDPRDDDPSNHVTQADVDRNFYNALYDWRMAPNVPDGTIDGRVDNLVLGGGQRLKVNAPAGSENPQDYLYDITDEVYESGVDYLGHSLRQAAEDRYLRYVDDNGGSPAGFDPQFQVDVAVHSTGGLVSRSYLQSDVYGADFDTNLGGSNVTLKLPEFRNYFQIAVPNRGSPNAWVPLNANFGITHDETYRLVLSKLIYKSLLLNADPLPGGGGGEGRAIESPVPGDDLPAGFFPADFADVIGTENHGAGDPEFFTDADGVQRRNYHFIAENALVRVGPTMLSLLSTHAFIDVNPTDAVGPDLPSLIAPQHPYLNPTATPGVDTHTEGADAANLWLADLNDGLDFYYGLQGDARSSLPATASPIGGGLGYDDGGTVRRPNEFADFVRGDTYAYFSRAVDTIHASVRRDDGSAPFSTDLLPPTSHLSEYFGHEPAAGELYYENQLQSSPYKDTRLDGTTLADADGRLVAPVNPVVPGGVPGDLLDYGSLTAGDGTVPTLSAIGQFAGDPRAGVPTTAGPDGDADPDIYVVEVAAFNDRGDGAGADAAGNTVYEGDTSLSHAGLTGNAQVQRDILARLGFSGVVVSTDLVRGTLDSALAALRTGALDPALADVRDQTLSQNAADGLRVGLGELQRWLANNADEDAWYNAPIPLVGRSFNDLLQPDQLLADAVVGPLIDLLDDDTGPTTGERLAALRDFLLNLSFYDDPQLPPAAVFGDGRLRFTADAGRTGFHIVGDGTVAQLGQLVEAANRAAGLGDTAAARAIEDAGVRDGVAFTLAGRVQFDADVPIHLGEQLAQAGLAAATDTPLRLTAYADLEYTVGYRLNTTGGDPVPDDEKFYFVPKVTYGLEFESDDPQVDLVLGLFKAGVIPGETANAEATATLSTALRDRPDGTPRRLLTLADLRSSQKLIEADGRATVDLRVPARFTIDGNEFDVIVEVTTQGQGPDGGEGNALVLDADGDHAQVAVRVNGQSPADFALDAALVALARFSPGDMTSVIAAVREAVNNVIGQLGGQEIPFTTTTVRDLARDAGLSDLFDPKTPNGEPINSFQGLIDALRQRGDGAVSDLDYDAVAEEWAFDLELDLAPPAVESTLSAAADFGGDFALPLAGVASNARVEITADLRLRMRVGFTLDALIPSFLAEGTLSPDAIAGRLRQAAALRVRLDNESTTDDPDTAEPVYHDLVLPAGRYDDAAGIVAALNGAIAGVPELAGRVEAYLAEADRLGLRGVEGGEVVEVAIDLGDAAARDLGFGGVQIGAVDAAVNAFVEPLDDGRGGTQPTLAGDLAIALKSADGAAFGEAFVGPLKLALIDPRTSKAGAAGAAIGVGFAVDVVNGVDPADRRVRLTDLSDALSDGTAVGPWINVRQAAGGGTLDFGLTTQLGDGDAIVTPDDPVRITIAYGDDLVGAIPLRNGGVVLFPDAATVDVSIEGSWQDLLLFDDLDLDRVLTAIRAFAQWLREMEQSRDALGQPTPGLSPEDAAGEETTVGRVLGIADKVIEGVDAIRAGETPEALQDLAADLNAAFREAFGVDDETVEPFKLVFEKVQYAADDVRPVLKLAFDFESRVADVDADVDLSLERLWDSVPALAGLDRLSGELSANAAMEVAGRVGMTVGLDLARALDGPVLFEDGDAFVGFNAGVSDVNASFGSALFDAFAVTGGNLSVGTPGTPIDLALLGVPQASDDAQNDPPHFGQAFLRIDPADGRPYAPIDTLTKADFDAGLDGTLDVSLPFEIAELNALRGTLGFRVQDVGGPWDAGTSNVHETVAWPDFGDVTAFDVLNDLGFLIGALDAGLAGLETVLDVQLLGRELPVIGAGLKDGADLIAQFRRKLAEIDRQTSGQRTTDVVEDVLENAFAALGLVDTTDATNGDPNQVRQTILTDGSRNTGVLFDLDLGGDLTLYEGDFALGLPGVDFELANLEVSVGGRFDWSWGFGVTEADGFFLTLPDGVAGDDLTLALAAGVTPAGGRLEGNLLFLRAEASQVDGRPFASLGGDVGVDLAGTPRTFTTAAGDERREVLRPSQISLDAVDSATLSAGARVDMHLRGSFGGVAALPSVDLDLAVDWDLANIDLLAGEAQTGTVTVDFNDVRLDFGDFVGEFLGPVLDFVEDAAGPLRPVLDFLTARVPVVSDLLGRPVTVLEMARQFSKVDVPDEAVQFIYVLDRVLDLAESRPDDGDVAVSLGSFRLGDGLDLTKPGAWDQIDVGGLDFGGVGALIDQFSGEQRDFLTELQNVNGTAAGGGTPDAAAGGFSIPILGDPSAAFKLLLGQNVSLIDWEAPPLGLAFEMSQRFPIFSVGVATAFLEIYGGLGVNAAFSVGVSSRGLQAFRDGDGAVAGTIDFLRKGIYIGDRADGGLGEDRPELTVEGTIGLGISLSAGPVYVSGGGDLRAFAEFDLRDGEGADRDGLVHLDEFARFFGVDPLCIFERISGGVDIGARFEAGLDLWLKRVPVFEYRTPRLSLVDFEVHLDCDPSARVPSETETVDIGRGPGQHVESTIGGTVARRHKFTVVYDDDPRAAGGSVDLNLIAAGGDLGNTNLGVVDDAGEEVPVEPIGLGRLRGNFEVGRTYFFVVHNTTEDAATYDVAVERAGRGRTFYVNDSRVDNDFPEDPSGVSADRQDYFTTAAGDDATALPDRPDRPFRTIGAVTGRYHLQAGDVILVDDDNGSGYSEGRIVFDANDGGAQVILADATTVVGTQGLFFRGARDLTLSGLNFRHSGGGEHAAMHFADGASGNTLVDVNFGYTPGDRPFDGTFTGGGWRDGVRFGEGVVDNRVVGGGVQGDSDAGSGGVLFSPKAGANNSVSGLHLRGFNAGVASRGAGHAANPDTGLLPAALPVVIENVRVRGTGSATGDAVRLREGAALLLKTAAFENFRTGLDFDDARASGVNDSTFALVGDSTAAVLRHVDAGLFEDLEFSAAGRGIEVFGGGNNELNEVTVRGRFAGGAVREHLLRLALTVANRVDGLRGKVADPNGAGVKFAGAERTEIVNSEIDVAGTGHGLHLSAGSENNAVAGLDLIGPRVGIFAAAGVGGLDFRDAAIVTTSHGVFLDGDGSHRVENVTIAGPGAAASNGTTIGLRTGGDFNIVRDLTVDGYGTGLLVDGGGYVARADVGQNAPVATGVRVVGDAEVADLTVTATGLGMEIGGGGEVYDNTVTAQTGMTVAGVAEVRDNDVTATAAGVVVTGTAVVRDNTIDAETGVTIADAATVHDNEITARSLGVVVTGEAVVRDNTIDAETGVTIANAATVHDNAVTARSLGVDVAGEAEVYENTVTSLDDGVRVGGDSSVYDNAVVARGVGINVLGGSAAVVRDNTVQGDEADADLTGVGVLLTGGGEVRGNLVERFDVGLDSAVVGIDVLANEIRFNRVGATGDGTIGSADPDATGERNDIHHNDVGVLLDFDDGSAVVRRNDVHDNRVGIERLNDSADVLINDVFANDLGLRIHGDFGSDSLAVTPNVVRDNVDGVELLGGLDGRDQTLRFTVIRDNSGRAVYSTVGSDITLHNNKVLRNGVGIALGGSDNVVRNNTVVGEGDAMRVFGATGPITLRNNIFVTATGAALDVDAESVEHLDSDYNLLYHGGGGLAVRHLKDFADVYDWRVESDFDRHSLGYTRVDPTRDAPLFVDLAADDTRLTPGQPAVDAGDPLTPVGGEPGDGGGRVNLGAHGGDATAAASPASWVRLLSPNFHEDRPATEGRFVTWETHDVAGDVALELLDDAGNLVATIATVPAAGGQYLWTPQDQGIAGSDADRYRLRLRAVAGGAVYTTRETFAVVSPGTGYYVNDDALVGDVHTTAFGDNRNTGLTPASPKASVRPILETYELAAGDTVFVDAGDHTVVSDLLVTNELGVGDDEGFVVRGVGPASRLDRANPFADWALFDLDDADNVTFRDLTLAGGTTAVRAAAASGGTALRDVAVVGTAGDAVVVADGADGFVAEDVTVTSPGGRGLVVGADDATLDRVTVDGAAGDGVVLRAGGIDVDALVSRDNAGVGVRFDFDHDYQAGGGSLTNSVVTANAGGGVHARTRYANPPRLLRIGEIGGGNRVADNALFGVDARGLLRVEGNAVVDNGPLGVAFLHTGNGAYAGLGGLGVRHNVVAGHALGVDARSTGSSGNAADVSFNRVDPAAGGTGVRVQDVVAVVGNEVRGGSVGLAAPTGFFRGVVEDNLVVGQSDAGLRLARVHRTPGILSNTVAVAGGANAVELAGDGEDVRLRDNVLQVEDGLAVSVADQSRDGFDSDFNLFHVTGAGGVGMWQGQTYATLDAWRAATSNDFASLSADPLFVDPAGGDYHLQSQHGSRHGGSLAPVLDAATGFAAASPGVLTNDAATSPGLDRADAATDVGDEPQPNGSFANLGAFGTTAQASLSPLDYVLVIEPAGGRTYPLGQSLPIAWRTEADYGGTVAVELVSGGSVVRTIAADAPNTGSLSWPIPADVPAGSYAVRVTRVDGVSATGGDFAVGGAINAYYVATTGSNANDGLSAASPMADVKALLDRYDLGPADTVLVAAGTYDLSQNLRIDPNDTGVTIVGAGETTVLDRGDLATGSWAVEVRADDVTLRAMALTGGDYGLVLPDGAATSGVIADALVIAGNDRGIHVAPGHDATALLGLDVTDYSDLDGSNTLIRGGAWHDVPTVFESDGPGLTVEDAEFFNTTGNALRSYGPDAEFRRNTFRDGTNGPYVRNGAILAGNEFFGYSGYGARVDWSTAQDNVFRDNGTGVFVQYGRATLSGNAVRDNAGVGIDARGDAAILDNLVLGNGGAGVVAQAGNDGTLVAGNRVENNAGVGLLVRGRGPVVHNNLVAGNAGGGIALGSVNLGGSDGGAQSATVRNNTLAGNAGFGVRFGKLGSSFSDVGPTSIRNNVVVQPDGDALSVVAGAGGKVFADFNVLDLAAGVNYADWAGTTYATRADLVFGLGLARHSIEADALLDADGRPLPGSPAVDAGDPLDDFSLEPAPAGTRVDAGHTGNTPDAQTSAAVKLDVIDPAGLERLPAGGTATARWATAGVPLVADATTAYRAAALAQSPSFLLGLDEPAGATTFADATGGPTVAVGTAAAGAGGPFAGATAVAFDGSSHLEVADSPLTERPRAVGMSLWLNLDALDRETVIVTKGFWSQGRLRNFSLHARADGALVFTTGDGSGFAQLTSAAGVVHAGTWQHLAAGFDRDAGLIRVWVDGRVVAEGAVDGSRDSYLGGDPLRIGGNGSVNQGVVGRFDEVALFPGLPTTADVLAAYAAPRGTVDLAVVDSAGTVTPVADDVPDAGTWTGPLPASLAGGAYALRVTHDLGAMPAGESREFTIVGDTSDYFVSPTGDDAADGTDATRPMRTLDALLAAYDLGPGDTVNLAAGTYVLSGDVTIDADDAGVTIAGDPAGGTVFDRGDTAFGTAALRLEDAGGTTLRDLRLTGGDSGLRLVGTNDGVTLDGLHLVANANSGVDVDEVARDLTVLDSTFAGQTQNLGGYGLRLDRADDLDGLDVRGSTFRDNRTGLWLEYSGAATYAIEGNVFEDNGTGLTATSGGNAGPPAGRRVVGNSFADNGKGLQAWYARVEGNTLAGNAAGIDAQRGEVVANTLAGGRNAQGSGYGLRAFESLVTGNAVSDSDVGIDAYGGTSAVEGNTLTANTLGVRFVGTGGGAARDNDLTANDVGLLLVNGGLVEANRAWANRVGIATDLTYSATGRLAHNVLWDNTGHALDLVGETATFFGDGVPRYAGIEVVNNTVVHRVLPAGDVGGGGGDADVTSPAGSRRGPAGDPTVPDAAVRVSDGFDRFDFAGNVVSVAGVGAWEVAAESAWRFASDYNVYGLTGGATYGTWAGTPVGDAAEWFYRLGNDGRSVEADPMFVDPAAADFRPQPGSPAVNAGPLDADASNEPNGGDGRVDAGHTGNTADAPAATGANLHAAVTRFAKADADHPVRVDWTADTSAVPDDQDDGLYRDEIGRQSPDAHYRLGGGADDSAGGLDGTAVGAIDFAAAGPFTNANADAAAAFAGDNTTDRIDLPASLLDGAGDVSVSAWVKGPDADPALLRGTLLSGARAGGQNEANEVLIQLTSADRIEARFKHYGFQGWTDLGLGDGGWHHLAVVRHAADRTAELFVDGVSQGAKAVNPSADNGPLSIDDGGLMVGQEQDSLGGGFNANEAFRGVIDELAVFRRAVTAAEVARQVGYARPRVEVDLLDAAGNAAPLGDAFDDGTLRAAIPAGTTPGQYRLRLTVAGESTTTDAFAVVRPGTAVHVDPLDGDDANDGKSPDAAVKSVVGALAAYDLGDGDTVRLASGVHRPLRNVRVTADDAGVTLAGATASPSVIDRGQRDVRTAYAVELADADGTTLRNLHVTGGHDGVAAADLDGPTTGWSIEGGRFFGNAGAGVRVERGNGGLTVSGVDFDGGGQTQAGLLFYAQDLDVAGSTFRDHAGTGLLVDERSQFDPNPYDINVAGSTFADNAGRGLLVDAAFSFDLRDNVLERNGSHGLEANGITSGGFGQDDQIVAGNLARDNAAAGFRVSNVGRVEGNESIGNDAGFAGFLGDQHPTLLAGNRAGLNRVGFEFTGGSANVLMARNVAFANDEAGFDLTTFGRLHLDANAAYSNTTGFDLRRFGGDFTNNLAYANADLAARVRDYFVTYGRNPLLANNTLWQPTGTALRIDDVSLPNGSAAETLRVRNNVLKVDNGRALVLVDVGLGSNNATTQIEPDFNLYDLGPSGTAGSWLGTDAATVADLAALNGDSANSLAAAAMFIDVDGADDVLGWDFVQDTDGGGDDNFALDAGSAAIDRGDDAFAPPLDAAGFARQDDPGTPDGPGGIADLGAFEFLGSTTDALAPTVVASDPPQVLAGGTIDRAPTVLALTFSEGLNGIDAAAAANYELRQAGPDGSFDTGDDAVIPLTPAYDAAANRVTLALPAALAQGDYRLTVSPVGSLRDLAGNALDGDGDGQAGGALVREFAVGVAAAVQSMAVADLDLAQSPAQRSRVTGAVVVFDRPHTPAAGDFTLRRVRDGFDTIVDQSAISLTWTDLDGDGLRWRIGFAGVAVGGEPVEGASLPDGVYELSARAGEGPATTLRLHRLFGDVNGDGRVNPFDNFFFRKALGTAAGDAAYDAAFDHDGDGQVDSSDAALFRQRYGRRLTI